MIPFSHKRWADADKLRWRSVGRRGGACYHLRRVIDANPDAGRKAVISVTETQVSPTADRGPVWVRRIFIQCSIETPLDGLLKEQPSLAITPSLENVVGKTGSAGTKEPSSLMA